RPATGGPAAFVLRRSGAAEPPDREHRARSRCTAVHTQAAWGRVCADDRRAALTEPRLRGQQQPDRDHRTCDGDIREYGRERSRPKRRKTPATMPMTIGRGTSSIARFTEPVAPSTSIRTLVT